MKETIRLLIVDDHSILRHGLRSILELEPNFTVVGEAQDRLTALRAIDQWQPDLVLLDLSLGPRGTDEGLAVCQAITTRYPHMGVIVLTTFLDEHLILQAIRSGAKGYILKDVDAVDLIKMIRAVSRGESALDTRSASLLMRNLSGAQPDVRASINFSQRELDVIRLVAQGLTNKAVGERMAISDSTVKFHLHNVMQKLHVSHRTEVVYAAGKLGLL